MSDTLGSISKCAFQRGIVKKDEGIADLSEVIELIKSELNVSTKKFSFFEVVEFDFIERSTEMAELVIQNISKQHSVAIRGTQVLSYIWTECTVSQFCDSCKKLKGTDKSFIKIKKAKQKVQDDSDEDETVEQFYDDNDYGQTDDEKNEEDDIESDNDSEEEDDDFSRVILFGDSMVDNGTLVY